MFNKIRFKPVKKDDSKMIAFIERHSDCAEKNEIIISTSHTGVGISCEAKCKTCGTREDVTDYDSF